MRRTGPDGVFLLLFAVLAAIFLLSRMDSLFIGSIDLAHHVVLVTRLMEHLGGGLDPSDPSTGTMALYPHYAHAIAAVVGSMVDSPVLGVHFVALVAVLLAWSSWAFAARSLPEPAGAMTGLWLGVLVLVGDRFVRLEVFGNEILVNFFYPQMVGQALACAVVATATILEARGGSAYLRYALLAGAAWLLTEFHLVPALQVFAFLALIVLADAIAARGRWTRSQTAGTAAILVALALILSNPHVRLMLTLAEHDGGLNLRYTPEPVHVAILAAAVAAVAALAVAGWLRLPEGARCAWAYWRAVALFALATAGLGIGQFMALKMGYGSPYSVKKHAFGLNASIILLLSVAFGSLAPWLRMRFRRLREIGSVPAWATVCLIPLALLGYRSFEPQYARIEASRLVNAERYARHAQQLLLGDPAPRRDYAIGLGGPRSIGDYLVSIASLHAAYDDNADAIRKGLPPPNGDLARYVLTSVGRAFWDKPACRRTPPALGLVFVEAGCVLADAVPPCSGQLDLTSTGDASPYAFSGLRGPADDGRWSDGGEASFTCRIESGSPAPRIIRFGTTAFVPPGHTQRLVAEMTGAEPTTAVYDAATPARDVALAVPQTALATGMLRVTFHFPDAVSPHDAGMGRDTQPRAIAFRTVSFAAEAR